MSLKNKQLLSVIVIKITRMKELIMTHRNILTCAPELEASLGYLSSSRNLEGMSFSKIIEVVKY